MSEVVGQQVGSGAAAHQSDARAQREAEALVLAGVAGQLGVAINQKVRLELGSAKVELDGATADESVLVEVFARVGKLKGGQLHKVSTDTLKLVALKQERPTARLVLAFADQEAAESVVGWRAVVLERNGIEKVVVDLTEQQRAVIVAAQAEQKMVNAPAEGD